MRSGFTFCFIILACLFNLIYAKENEPGPELNSGTPGSSTSDTCNRLQKHEVELLPGWPKLRDMVREQLGDFNEVRIKAFAGLNEL
jgi:hypothetical protein